MNNSKEKVKEIASLQVKWGKNAYSKVTLTETGDKSAHTMLVSEFCSLANIALKLAGLDCPTIGIIPSDIFGIEEKRFEWSKVTFPDATASTSLHHLKDEIREIEFGLNANEPDIMEFVDAQMLLWDSAQRAGITLPQLFDAFAVKFIENQSRVWEKHPNGHYKHIEGLEDNGFEL